MFSRFVLLLAISASIVSCGLNTGEEPPAQPAPAYSGEGFQCVGAIPEHVEKYVGDRLSEEELNTFMRCLQKSFVAFAQLTRGAAEESYAPEEIRRFLQTYFIKNKVISDEFLRELMILKRALVGGSDKSITRTEVYTAVEILEELRVEALRIKPHIKMLNPSLAKLQRPDEIGRRMAEAYAVVETSIRKFGGRLQKSPYLYSLSNLNSFLSEFRKFIGWDDHFRASIPVGAWTDLLRVFKTLTVSPVRPDVIRPGDWIPLMQALSRWYLVYIELEVGVIDHPKLHGVGLQNTFHLVKKTFELIEEAISRQDGMVITYPQMMEVVRALNGVHWMPSTWRPESVESALHALIGRVFGDVGQSAAERRAGGLTLRALNRVRDTFFNWAEIQMTIEAQHAEGRIRDPSVPDLQFERQISVVSRQASQHNPKFVEFIKVKQNLRPLFAAGSSYVTLAPPNLLDQSETEFGFYNLSMMNMLHSIVGMIFRGYAGGANAEGGWESGLTAQQMESFYNDFREIGIDLGFVDRRNHNTGARVFIEGNLFTYSADGLVPGASDKRGKMTFAETMELFAFLYSGGTMSGEMYDWLANQKGCQKGPPDLYGRAKLRRLCVSIAMPQVYDKMLTNMPLFHEYFVKLAPFYRQGFSNGIMELAYSPANSEPDWVELSELSTIAVVLHYAEAVMTKVDGDQDGKLTNAEVETAVPIFRGFIKWFAKEKLGRDLDDAQSRGAFYFILIHKRMPENWVDYFVEVPKLSYAWTDGVALDRYELSTVFKVIISKLMASNDKPTTPLGETPVAQ